MIGVYQKNLDFPLAKLTTEEMEAKWRREINYWHNGMSERRYSRLLELELQTIRRPYRYPEGLQKMVEELFEEEAKQYVITQGVFVKLLKFIDYEFNDAKEKSLKVIDNNNLSDFFYKKANRLLLMRDELTAHIRNIDILIAKLMHTTGKAIQDRMLSNDILYVTVDENNRLVDRFLNDLHKKIHANQSNPNTQV